MPSLEISDGFPVSAGLSDDGTGEADDGVLLTTGAGVIPDDGAGAFVSHGPGVFVAENRNLVLDQRVVEDGYVFHKIKSSSFFYLFSGV